MTKIIGISAFYHDSAASLIEDGIIIAAAQEERFSRKKHDDRFPKNAIKFLLAKSNCSLNEIDNIIFYEELETYYENGNTFKTGNKYFKKLVINEDSAIISSFSKF